MLNKNVFANIINCAVMKINIFIQNSFQHEIHHVAVLKDDECLLLIFLLETLRKLSGLLVRRI